MTGFVADSSCVIAWLLDDEHSAVADRLFRRVIDGERIAAPPLLRYEVCNVLITAYAKRKRISVQAFQAKLKLFEKIPIEYDRESGEKLATRTAEIAVETKLSAYDAAYLEAASRLQVPLATLDEKLKRAAIHFNLSIL